MLAAQRIVLGPKHVDLAATLNNLSIAQLARGEADDALRSAEEATTLLQAVYGKTSGREVESMLAASDALLAAGRTADAVQASATATARSTSVFGPEHLTTAYAMRSWGTALRAHGDSESAAEKLRAAKSLFRKLGVALEVEKTDAP